MVKRELKSNYIIAFINLFLFLILFCFVYSLSREFLQLLRLDETIKTWVLFLGAVFPLAFYTFIADLNPAYEKTQYFFFRHTFLYIVAPALFIILSLVYFLIPKIFAVTFNKSVFLFLGGVVFSAHAIFVAHQTKSPGFTGFINYIFILSMIYILSLFYLGFYLTIGYNFHLSNLLFTGFKDGFGLVKSIILQLLPGS